ncbi:MAG: hypothetical protein ACLP8S_30295, partial [Solirubrobacteraceae bacterium]
MIVMFVAFALLVFLILSPVFLYIARLRYAPGTRVHFRDTNRVIRFGTVDAYPRYDWVWGKPGLLVKLDDGIAKRGSVGSVAISASISRIAAALTMTVIGPEPSCGPYAATSPPVATSHARRRKS